MVAAARGLFAEALSALQTVGWSVVAERSADPLLTPAQLHRYAEAPSVLLECLATLSVCHNRSKPAWLYRRPLGVCGALAPWLSRSLRL